jgi:DnaJ-class molecular chaperone
MSEQPKCPRCEGYGYQWKTVPCPDCDGTGKEDDDERVPEV